ncbi:MAG: hypothetical protein ACPGYX_08720 [Oceanobacter sp.]
MLTSVRCPNKHRKQRHNKTNKEINMSDYTEELLDVSYDDYEDDGDDAIEM